MPRLRTPRTHPTETKREPLVTWEAFEPAHLQQEAALKRYLEAGRKRSVRLSGAVLEELDPSAAMWLHANNHTARLNFARIAKQRVDAFTESTQDTLFFWMMLCPKQFVVREDEAAEFKIRRIHAWV